MNQEEMTTNKEFMEYYNLRISMEMISGTLEQEYEMYQLSIDKGWL